jgi:5-methylcytosine-specific restriction endonuclease McrA
MQPYAERFYKSKTWQQCRAAYAKRVGGLCERCRAHGRIVPGVIVHHKIHITPENINDPNITLDFNNMELLCRDCHTLAHTRGKRYKVDELGRVIALP